MEVNMLLLRCYMKKIVTSFFVVFCLSLLIVEPVLASLTPNDRYYRNQWYLGKIKADSAWSTISESPDIVIAVIDSGVDINHPDLANNIWINEKEIPNNNVDEDHNGYVDDYHGWDFVNNSSDPSPKFLGNWTEAGISHGTMVSGIIAAQGNNNQGVVGVTWKARIMPLKVLNDKGDGKISDVIRAIDYAVLNGADIINLSFVNFNYNQGMQDAIRRAHSAGIIIVAAAGNEQANGIAYNITKTPIYPACYDGEQVGENMVIGVVATDALDQKASFSSYGSRCVDIAAPGISFFNTVVPGTDQNDYNKYYDGYWSGTSMAAPLVTGALALIEQANPELSSREVVNILFASTDNISLLNPDYPGQLGNGRLNIARAVEMAKAELYNHIDRLLLAPITQAKTFKISATNGDLVSDLKGTENLKISSVAAGDINGDGIDEIVYGLASGAEPQVQISNTKGKIIKKFLAYDKSFRGGVNIAVSDIDNDGRAEIITAPASNGSPLVKIFDENGKLEKQFFAYDKKLKMGLNLAAAYLNDLTEMKILVASGAGSEPIVKIFSLNGKLVNSSYVYEKKFRGGVKIAVANLDGRQIHNQPEIIVAPGAGRDPQVKIFDSSLKIKKQFLAYKTNWRGGVNISAGDINNDGIAEIVLGANQGAAPHVRIFDGEENLIESFYAWSESFKGGVNLAIIKMNN